MNKKKRNIIITIAVVVAGFALGFLWEELKFVSTDDAYVQAHVVMIAPKVGGIVTQVFVDENQEVKKGQVLAEIDNRDYENSVANAEAQLESLKARAAEDQKNFRRISQLYDSQAVSSQQYDSAKAANDEAARKVAGAQAELDQQRLNLEHTKILAPSDGSIAKKSVEPGALVTPGQALFGFVSSESRWVTANFKETELSKIRVGLPVKIEVDAIPSRSFFGEVDSISSSTGSTFTLLPPDNASGNFTKVVQRVPVKIKFDNLTADDIRKLQSGLSAVVSIKVR